MQAVEDSELSARISRLIRAWREDRELSQQLLADRAGISKNAVSLYERGGASPSIHQVEKIVNALRMSFSRFLQGPNGMQEDLGILDSYDMMPKDATTLVKTVSCLFFVGVPVGGFAEENSEGIREMPEDLLPHDDMVVVKINNGMMYPTLIEGDLVLVDTRVKKPKSNDVVCAEMGGATYIARFKRQDRTTGLIPDNPRYEPVTSKRMRDVTIFGQVVKLIHRDVTVANSYFPV